MPEARPQFLGDVRSHRRQQQHQRLGHCPRCSRACTICLGDVVVQLDELGDGGVEPQRGIVLAHPVDGSVQRSEGVQIGPHIRVQFGVHHPQLAGVLVNQVAPQSLQEAVGADDVLGRPRPGDVQGAH